MLKHLRCRLHIKLHSLSLNVESANRRDECVVVLVFIALVISLSNQKLSENVLRVDSNKTELFTFLSDALLRWLDVVQEDKQLFFTDDVAVRSKPLLADLS